VEINEAGDITRLVMRDWARAAFLTIAACGLQNALDRTPAHFVASYSWVVDRAA
jgi:hypothetical protein